MNYFRNFIALAILATTLFAGQALSLLKLELKIKNGRSRKIFIRSVKSSKR